MTSVTGEIVGLQMDLTTAREHIDSIKYHLEQAGEHLNRAREKILDLHQYEGWKVLGYTSWRQCVTTEFQKSSSTVYRQLSAALVELELSPNGGIGKYSERTLRPLTHREFDSAARSAIMCIAQEAIGEGGKVTGSVVEQTIEVFKQVLTTSAVESGDGSMFPLGEVIKDQIVAQVRERRIAHQEDVRRMGKKRDYLLGSVAIEKITRGQLEDGRVAILVSVDELQRAKILEATKRKFYTDKPIYISLWTED